MPLRSVKMKRFILGFQRRVWCPKWTPLSSSWRMVTTAMARPSGAHREGARQQADPSRGPASRLSAPTSWPAPLAPCRQPLRHCARHVPGPLRRSTPSRCPVGARRDGSPGDREDDARSRPVRTGRTRSLADRHAPVPPARAPAAPARPRARRGRRRDAVPAGRRRPAPADRPRRRARIAVMPDGSARRRGAPRSPVAVAASLLAARRGRVARLGAVRPGAARRPPATLPPAARRRRRSCRARSSAPPQRWAAGHRGVDLRAAPAPTVLSPGRGRRHVRGRGRRTGAS